ncbi:serine hydrolase domain-containing protein [Bacillus sp. T33-2]|uniref:serine hydrolase domain-containing protein n=1 Tax=Bacillus sp. T33-2 TaxID=2054168 RepID=UPI000C75BCB8|nr:serine hydrolase domain-containing protein [Bacillus sp. T33-2]PLR98448.1 serine hydrolase [Bacillus sp. T33-2]
MKREQAKLMIENKMRKTVSANQKLLNAYLLIHSDTLNIHWNMAFGETDKMPAIPHQPYHTASIGKTFTAIIIAMLAEEGKLNFSDPISNYLNEDIIKDLHIHKGKDYSHEIRIEHLLSNTSGLPDYYELKPKGGKHFLKILLEDASRVWTPQETIEWSKQYLRPRFPPGKGYHYTNTGFNLLGLIIENITSKPYQEVLHEYIFKRLNMNESYLSQFSEPAEKSSHPVANVYSLDRPIRVEDHRSFSSVYAAGQTVSTSEDLLVFMKALAGNQLISQKSFSAMQNWTKMWMGVDYGYGLMRIRMVPFTEKYNVWGHLGSIASFMLYNPSMDVYIIGNFNNTAYLRKSIGFVYNTLKTVSKTMA